MKKINIKYINIIITVLITTIVTVIITLSVIKNTPKENPQNSEPSTQVQTKIFHAITHDEEILLTGISQASASVDIKARVSGIIQDIKSIEGKKITANTTILTIGENNLEQIAKDAKTTLEQKEFEYSNIYKLLQNNNTSKEKYLQAKSMLETARSNMEISKINAENNIVKAPFNGSLGKIYVNQGDFVTINTILTTINSDNLEFASYASEKELLKIKIGAQVIVKYTNGEKLTCSVKFINPKSLPHSTSHLVETLCKTTNNEQILFGQLANLSINAGKEKYISIPFSTVFLDDSGNPNIKIIKNNMVKKINIKIIGYQNNGNIKIKAPTDKLRIITYGQLQVKDGDKFNN